MSPAETDAAKDDAAAQKPAATTGDVKTEDKDKDKATDAVRMVDGKPVMHVKVYSPFKVYFDDDAFSISAVNDTGPFDILPRHHNFLTLLSPCDIQIRSTQQGTDKRIKIARGIMHVKADKVIVFLDV